jgi:hypothetical protein
MYVGGEIIMYLLKWQRQGMTLFLSDVCLKWILHFILIYLECSNTGCWGEYLGQKGVKWQEAGETCIIRSYVICFLEMKDIMD